MCSLVKHFVVAYRKKHCGLPGKGGQLQSWARKGKKKRDRLRARGRLFPTPSSMCFGSIFLLSPISPSKQHPTLVLDGMITQGASHTHHTIPPPPPPCPTASKIVDKGGGLLQAQTSRARYRCHNVKRRDWTPRNAMHPARSSLLPPLRREHRGRTRVGRRTAKPNRPKWNALECERGSGPGSSRRRRRHKPLRRKANCWSTLSKRK